MGPIDLEACIRGDARAWQVMLDQTMPLISAMVRRTLGNARRDETILADTVQEVFVRLIRNDYALLRSFDPDRAKLSTWLALVARSVALNQLRRPSPRMVALDHLADHPRDPSPDPSEAADDPQAVPTLDELPPDLLSDRQQRIMDLIYRRAFTVPEAAAAMEVTEQTVRSMHHKAIEKIRAFLGVRKRK